MGTIGSSTSAKLSGLGGSRKLPSLVKEMAVLPQVDPMYKVILDSRFLFNEQVTLVARRAFIQLWVVCLLHLFPDQETLLQVTHSLVAS